MVNTRILVLFTVAGACACLAAGVAVPSQLNIDGRSFLPQLKGKKGNPREWAYCWYLSKKGTVEAWARTQRYKLYLAGTFCDMSADPLEQKPLRNLTPEASEAQALLKSALSKYEDARPADLSQPE